MRVVVALGGNALLKRGEPMTSDVQRANVRVAAQALAPIAKEHQLVITHGNGPQVGLLALQGAAYKPDEAYPLDVLGAETEGMIGYMIEQELGNLLPFEVPFATLLTMVEVDADDPGFSNPTKFVGPVYEKPDADRIAKEKGWVFKQDGTKWRRVVASPLPQRIFEIRPISGCSITARSSSARAAAASQRCTNGARIAKLIGVEAVIDKDLCSELLARELERRSVRDVDRRGSRVRRLGQTDAEGDPPRLTAVVGGHTNSPPGRWGRRCRPRVGSHPQPARARRSARSRI